MAPKDWNLIKETIMEGELWKKVYKIVMEMAKNKTIKRATFSNAQIVLTYFWAVIHDRPVYWACKKKNWPIYYRRNSLPTPSTMTRRLRRDEIQQLLKNVEQRLVGMFERSICRYVDGKPLAIGGASKDKEAKFGHGASCICKGYKLHAVSDLNQGFVQWAIRPMNEGEPVVARELVHHLDGNGYLVADTAYDSNKLYDAAAERDIQLVAARKSGKALGHRKHSPHRIRSRELLDRPFGQTLLAARTSIERMFGNLVSFPCGLKPLPHWVRTLFRVEMWVRAKMILYQLWRIDKMKAKEA